MIQALSSIRDHLLQLSNDSKKARQRIDDNHFSTDLILADYKRLAAEMELELAKMANSIADYQLKIMEPLKKSQETLEEWYTWKLINRNN